MGLERHDGFMEINTSAFLNPVPPTELQPLQLEHFVPTLHHSQCPSMLWKITKLSTPFMKPVVKVKVRA